LITRAVISSINRATINSINRATINSINKAVINSINMVVINSFSNYKSIKSYINLKQIILLKLPNDVFILHI
jgi:hypothetical protein